MPSAKIDGHAKSTHCRISASCSSCGPKEFARPSAKTNLSSPAPTASTSVLRRSYLWQVGCGATDLSEPTFVRQQSLSPLTCREPTRVAKQALTHPRRRESAFVTKQARATWFVKRLRLSRSKLRPSCVVESVFRQERPNPIALPSASARHEASPKQLQDRSLTVTPRVAS